MAPRIGALLRRAWSQVLEPEESWQRLTAAAIIGVISTVGALAAAEVAAVPAYSLIVLGMLGVTWYAGLRHALLASLVAGALSLAFIEEPRSELSVEASLARASIGILSAVGASFLLDMTRRALTERVRAEEEVRLSERRYRSLTEASTSVIWVVNAGGQVVEPQPDWERYTGQRWPDYRGTGFLEMVHPEDRQDLVQSWQTALSTLTAHSFPARVWHGESQSWRHCDNFAVPLKSQSAEVVEWIGTTNDVEDRYQVMALEHLRASGERTRLAEAVARLGMWEWDLEGRFVWSQGLANLFELESDAEQSLESLLARVHHDDRERFADTFRTAARYRHDIGAEFRIVVPDGAVHWIYARGSLMEATPAHAARIVGIVVDVTEAVKTREALSRALGQSAESLALVDAVLDTTPAGVAIFDKEMRFTRINQAAAEINGIPAESHLGRRLEEVLPGVGPEAAARYRQLWSSGLAMPVEEISGETPAQPGVLRWWEHTATPVRDGSGHITAIAVIFHEITARKRAEEALRTSEQRQRYLSEVTKALIYSLDGRTLVAEIARLAVPRLGDLASVSLLDGLATPQSLAGDRRRSALDRINLREWRAQPGSEETIGDLLMRGSPIVIRDVTDEWLTDCAPTEEARATASSLRPSSLVCLPMVARGRTIGCATFAMTSSRRSYSDSDLALAEELVARASTVADNARLLRDLQETADDLRHANAAKDEFLGLVSHELKTPLTTILGNSDILRRALRRLDADAQIEALEDIHVNAERLQRLIDNMLMLARLERGREVELEPLLLNKTVDRVVDEYRRKQPDRPITVHSAAADTIVIASSDYVEQVLTNLVGNADKYSPTGTPVDITVTRNDREVSVDVLDRGPGIAEEEAESIFEPFYRSPRTAAKAEGIGIGLAVCKRVVEAQHGQVWARRRPGGGSDFGFSLPAAVLTATDEDL